MHQVEFNNAVKENNTHSLRHGAKKSNIEKNQNPRIIPCEYYAEFLSNIRNPWKDVSCLR